MDKDINYLEQVLQNLPTATITYTQKPNVRMDVPYSLTAKNYKEFYLGTTKQPDLTPMEQLILLNANNSDPTYTPSTVLAGIFKARKIAERSTNSSEAINKCNKALVQLNQETLKRRACIAEQISKKAIHANLLEYYLNVESKCREYDKKQQAFTAPVRNLASKLLEKITRKPHPSLVFSQDERERGAKAWEEFRLERGAKPEDSNQKVLKQYRYNSDIASGEPFSFMYNDPELSSLKDEYNTTNLALQVLDGSAYMKAERSLNRNPRKYLAKVKALSKEHTK